MARHPVSDERSVLGPPSNSPYVERFFLGELAAFLRASKVELAGFLRQQGLVRTLRLQGRGWARWTTKRGVELAIVHFRSKQTRRVEAGKPWSRIIKP